MAAVEDRFTLTTYLTHTGHGFGKGVEQVARVADPVTGLSVDHYGERSAWMNAQVAKKKLAELVARQVSRKRKVEV